MKGMEALDPEESAFSKLIASVFKKDSHETPRAPQRNTRKVANLIILKKYTTVCMSFHQLFTERYRQGPIYSQSRKGWIESVWI